jgi:glycosyltransferase involved in cell wall biosynthesis
VIIPLHRDSATFRECLRQCLELEHADFEVVVVSDQPVAMPADTRVRFVLTGSPVDTSPAVKRDIGARHATGEALAYLDDDAYPARDWLSVAEVALGAPAVDAIGGPGVTPPGSSLRARAGGLVYASPLGSGPLRYRFTPQAARVVDDYPAYNLIVKAECVARIGGWASTFYGGEDTRFCERLSESGVMVNYHPELVVYHFRRPLFRAHMRQIANVGRHRGYFARIYPGTSLRPVYFAPLVAVVGMVAALAAVLVTAGVAALVVTLVIGYLAAAIAAGSGTLGERALFPLGVVAHHASYGLAFARGLATRDLRR